MKGFVICEGPEDVAALREIAMFLFACEVEKKNPSYGPAGLERRMTLKRGDLTIEIVATANAKSGLAKTASLKLEGLIPGNRSDDPASVGQIAVIFDPDECGAPVFFESLSKVVGEGAPSWKLDEFHPGVWTARRDGFEPVELRAIPWRAPGGVVDSLPDSQNLDRLCCAVAREAFLEDSEMVIRWLEELAVKKKRIGWKSALHLWCAIVDEKAGEITAAARFLHQNKACRPKVRPILEGVSLLKDLEAIFGPPT
jgi:hypothetical protein